MPRFFERETLRYTLRMSGLDQDLVRYAVSTARREGFRTVKLRSGDDKFSAVIDLESLDDSHDIVDGETVAEAVTPTSDDFDLTAPVVGYFRDAKENLKPGATVEAGAAVCEIVALGLANDVTAKRAGEIIEVFVQAGDPVEYGQRLATVRSS